MRQFFIAATAACLVVSVGCGRSPEQASAPDAAKAVAKSASTDAPVQVVNQFLDALRRGGGEQTVSSLLTEAARKECQRTGLKIEPLGSPDARFEVTRGEFVPGRQDAALVHSVWSEPSVDGEAPQKNEIVWALKLEAPNAWRISGMVAEIPGEEPIAVDFENGDEVLSHLMGKTPAATTAAAPNSTQPPR